MSQDLISFIMSKFYLNIFRFCKKCSALSACVSFLSFNLLFFRLGCFVSHLIVVKNEYPRSVRSLGKHHSPIIQRDLSERRKGPFFWSGFVSLYTLLGGVTTVLAVTFLLERRVALIQSLHALPFWLKHRCLCSSQIASPPVLLFLLACKLSCHSEPMSPSNSNPYKGCSEGKVIN